MIIATLSALLVGLLFAGTGIAGKFLAGYGISPFVTSFFRFAMSSVILIPFLKRAEFNKIDKNFIGYFFLLGLTGIFLFNVLFFSALQYSSAITVNLIAAANPIIALLVAAILTRTMPTKEQLCALVLAFIGISIIIMQQSNPSNVCVSTNAGLGQFLALAAVCSQVAYAMLVKKIGSMFTPVFIAFAVGIAGLILLLPFIVNGSLNAVWLNMDLVIVLCLLYIGTLGGALPATLYIHAIKNFGAPLANLIVFTAAPVFTALLSILILGVAPTCWHLVGGSFVLIALFLGLRHAKK